MPPALLPRIAAGDRSAVRECIDRYGAIVWSLARRATKTSAEAETATLEIFGELWRVATSFDPRRSSEPLFVTMVARRRLLRRRLERSDDGMPSSERSTAGGGNVAPELGVEAVLAAKTLELLPPSERQALVLTSGHSLTYDEAAITMGTTPAVVRENARRGLLRVRACLDDVVRIQGEGGATQPIASAPTTEAT